MNEVRNIQTANRLVASSASSKGAVEAQPRTSGKDLPKSIEKPADSEQPQAVHETQQKLQSAVESINSYVQSVQRDLEFSVDEELNQTVVKVVDSDSGELIRQIPEDIFLELARKLKDDGEFRLLNALG
ncbi:flagellar protein FlaG [Teredinibacter sp. KSP-S5-2]|uniref:flagellar protein FlaG n=1 Tax=Teredinibacter sp. KSP-S5-2 TaxID=3034506 RepID=UPI002934990A|nr:flagellar protein FlaG [Teredinibacter sp. KSP-S5-2]WNO07946.1 flagellar protein FlaG [Teredinibacter sp. KSP-S5-2]